jgi:hypothetical protein
MMFFKVHFINKKHHITVTYMLKYSEEQGHIHIDTANILL